MTVTNDLKSVANLRQRNGFFSLKMKIKSYTPGLHMFPEFFYISGMNRFKDFVEWNAFGVCSAIGNRMGIATSRIRQYFIYTSLLTMGSPIIIYMVLAFWRNLRKYVTAAKRNPWYYL